MKKRILAMLLCVAMLLLPVFIPMAYAQESESEYHENIGRKAYFNERYASNEGGPIFISKDPATEANWSAAPMIDSFEIPLDAIFVIEDVYVDETQDVYWYQISMADGSELPDVMGECTWVMQNWVGEPPEWDSLILMEAEPEETEPQETEPTETDPGMSDPGMSDPGMSDPGMSDPGMSDPGMSDPGPSDSGESDSEESDSEESDTEESDPEESEPEYTQTLWLTYEAYAQAQNQRVMEDPEIYVGFSATFDVNTWANFQYAAAPDQQIPGEGENILDAEELLNEQGESIRVVITGYAFDEEGRLWYQIEAEEGSVLPEVLQDNPYILHVDSVEDPASLVIQPLLATFTGDKVTILNKPYPASKFEILDTEELPPFFTVTPVGDGMFDLGDIADWSDVLTEAYHYAWAEAGEIALIAPEVTNAFVDLLSTYDLEGYDALWASLPTYVKAGFTDQHLQWLHEYRQDLIIVTYNKEVPVNGTNINVSVTGNILEDVTLEVTPVTSADVMAEGFDIKSADEVIVALDIKLLRTDGTEWQPETGKFVQLSIGVAELGISDGTIVRLHHKHEDQIHVQDIFVVMDGKLDIVTGGFSIFVVQNVGSTTRGTETANNGTTSINIGDTRVFYFSIPGNWGGDSGDGNGTWRVTDPTGAIHYTVHANVTNSEDIGNGQVSARWIRIVGLKATEEAITLVYDRGNSTQTFYLNVTVPEAENGKKRLYIKDEVNTTGCLVAAVVDDQGNEVSLDGAAFSWSRRDNVNGDMYIVPDAYERGYQAVNIARDHGGLVEARKTDTAYVPTVYTLDVILADGTELTASYTVYYQSEIINAGFEFPGSKDRDYSFFPNGYPELYWKTTAPGTGTGNITKDIEYGDVTGLTGNTQGNTNYGVWRAADYDPETGKGTQFAELNAEAVGALYQDIITAPHEDIEWEFAHAKRPNQDWASDVRNKMYLVIGPTEEAQKLTNGQLNALVRQARTEANGDAAFLNCQRYEEVTYEGAVYWVWYHDADDQTNYSASGNYGWELLEGSYTVPENQYRTRVFFVSDPDSNTQHTNAGNVIDTAVAGQYKTYMIEYYEQTYVNGELVTNRIDDMQETGEALIYSSAPLKNFNYFIENEHDYLYKILINDKNYPYDIRYSNQPALYIEKYEGMPVDQLPGGTKSYEGYDIVMQIFLRDTVVAVQKELRFPVDSEGKELLTEEQKLTIMEELNKNGGYQATFFMDLVLDASDYTYHQEGSAFITHRDPAGKYKGFIALGDNPELGHFYQIEEIYTTPIVGLELSTVTFGVTRYELGKLYDTLLPATYTENDVEKGEPLICTPFSLVGDIKIADVVVINTYKEKETTIYYKAVGNGKVKQAEGSGYHDTPTETLAFYSGKAKGAVPQAGKGATFIGWFKDPECTIPVTAADGVYDSVTKSFKPNANIIAADEVTFYAKFDTGSIVIRRENAEPGQIFVYRVEQVDEDNEPTGVEFYVSVEADKDGNYIEEIVNVPNGRYKITEVGNWSWRYLPDEKTIDHPGQGTVTVQFGGQLKNNRWLSGLSDLLKNIFGGGT